MLGGTKFYAGLDVGDALVKVAVVGVRRDGPFLAGTSVVTTPDEALTDGAVTDPGLLAPAIREALAAGPKVKLIGVVPLVAGAHLTVRSLSLPPMSRTELRDAAKWEAAQYLPFPAEEASFDIVEVAQAAEMVEALFVGCRASVVDGLVAAAEAAGLTCLAVDAGPAALPRLLGPVAALPAAASGAREAAATQEQAGVAFLDIGSRSSNVGIFRNGLLRVNRTIPVGGKDLDEAVAGALGVSSLPVQRPKVDLALAGNGDDQACRMAAAARAVLEDLAQEVQRSLDYFRAQTQWLPVSRVVLTGGASLIPGIEEFLAEALETPVSRPDPAGLARLGLQSVAGLERKDLAIVGGALGAALREVSEQ